MGIDQCLLTPVSHLKKRPIKKKHKQKTTKTKTAPNPLKSALKYDSITKALYREIGFVFNLYIYRNVKIKENRRRRVLFNPMLGLTPLVIRAGALSHKMKQVMH